MKRFLIGTAVFVMGMILLSKPMFVQYSAAENGFRSVLFTKAEKRRQHGVPDAESEAEFPLEKKKIALTFDDGPTPGCTDRLLDGLAERNVNATFFVIGQKAELYPDLVKREAEEGHLVGNHTYCHVQLNKVSKEEADREITATNEILQAITGREVEYIRPPFGEWDRSLEKELDMIPVLWTVDPLDWRSTDVDEIVQKIVTNAKENDIILMHDDYQTSVQAALLVIDILTEQGYAFVTVDDMIMD